MSRRNGRRVILAGLLTLCAAFHLGAADCRAAETEYTYEVVLYAGNHGTFNTNEVLSSIPEGAKAVPQGDRVVISGIKYGSSLTFSNNIMAEEESGSVSMPANSKYYVRGIRQSGRDNDQVGLMRFDVTRDQSYVVAYGVQGDMVSYTVNYQTASGAELAPSLVLRGNVGDRPIVSARYFDGYRPQAYNLTGTLLDNAAQNVFTFVYTPVSSGGGGGGTTGGGGAAGTPPASGGTPGAPGAAGGTAAGGGAQAGDDGAQGAMAEELPDAEVPEGEPEELLDIRDEETPLAQPKNEIREAASRNFKGAAVVAGAGAIALLALLVLLLKRRRAEAAKDSGEDRQ